MGLLVVSSSCRAVGRAGFFWALVFKEDVAGARRAVLRSLPTLNTWSSNSKYDIVDCDGVPGLQESADHSFTVVKGTFPHAREEHRLPTQILFYKQWRLECLGFPPPT